jgi:hypothetical protein
MNNLILNIMKTTLFILILPFLIKANAHEKILATEIIKKINADSEPSDMDKP